MSRRPTVDIVIVDFNSWSFTQECLVSIAVNQPQLAHIGRVVVVPNGSVQPASESVNGLGYSVEIIANGTNVGFAAACNKGASGSSADYLLFLNPDTRLLPGSLDVPVAFLEDPDHTAIGIVGVQMIDPIGEVSRTCSRHPRLAHFLNKILGLNRLSATFFPSGFMSDWNHNSTRSVDVVMGAYFLVRKPLFELLGGFDERFFVYFEEVDFTLRAKRTGYQTYYLAEARCYHRGQGTSDAVKAVRLFYSLQSRLRYAEKHFNVVSTSVLKFATLFIEPFSRMMLASLKQSESNLRQTVEAYHLLWKDLLKAQ